MMNFDYYRRYGSSLKSLKRLGVVIGAAWLILGTLWAVTAAPALGQIQIESLDVNHPTSRVIVEPGQFETVFRFRLRDVDPVQNDTDAIGINCIHVKNLGSARNGEIADVRIKDDRGNKLKESTKAPGGLPSSVSRYCPNPTPANGPASFESFFAWDSYRNGSQSSAFQVDDVVSGQFGPARTFDVQVKMGDVDRLRDNVRNHTLQLQVTVQYEEANRMPNPRNNDPQNDKMSDEDGPNDDPGNDRRIDEDPIDGQNNDPQNDSVTDEDPPVEACRRQADPAKSVCNNDKSSNNDDELDEDPIGRATVSVTDPEIDRIQNRGINDVFRANLPTSIALPIPEANPSQTSSQSMTQSELERPISKFSICDGEHPDSTSSASFVDVDAKKLELNEINVKQGASGTATSEDILQLALYEGTFNPSGGSNVQVFSANVPPNGFDRGGGGVSLSGGSATIGDDECQLFTLTAMASSTATRGRTIQPIVTLIASEGGISFTPQRGLAPTVESRRSVIIGGGILQIRNRTIPTGGGPFPVGVRAVKLPNGLSQIRVQTTSIQFNPDTIQIDSDKHIEGINGFRIQSESVEIDNRSGSLRFILENTGSSQLDDGTGKIAQIWIKPRPGASPGTQTSLLFQVDKVLSASPERSVTRQIVLSSGSVKLIDMGDVDLDGEVMVSDVLKLAQQLISDCEGLNEEQRFVADVAGSIDEGDKAPEGKIPSCTDNEASAGGQSTQEFSFDFDTDGEVDLNSKDLRRIAELAILEEGNVSSSNQTRQREDEASSGWWDWLMRSLGLQQRNEATLEWSKSPQRGSSWDLSASTSGTSIGGFQGRIQYDPEALNVQDVQGINGYDVLASRTDAHRGEIRFLAMAPQDSLKGSHRILRLETGNSTSMAGPRLQLSHLVDSDGQSIPFEVRQDQPIQALQISALELQRPSTDRWTLDVRGQGIQNVAVQGYDLGGRPRFHERAQGTQLEWRALDEQTGRPLANGVYLYRVTVEGVHGEVWRSDVRKVVVLR